MLARLGPREGRYSFGSIGGGSACVLGRMNRKAFSSILYDNVSIRDAEAVVVIETSGNYCSS